jgi:membrane associated rhomboid family serine protease
MMPNGHLVKLAAQQAIENRDFMVALNAKNVPVVWTIVILCVGAFILQLITANGTHAVTGHRSFDLELSPQDLVRQGGDYLPAILRGGWHRLLVSGFLHSSILHLVMNMFALVQIGPFCERLLGSRSFLIIYLAALLGSAWVSGVSYGSSLVSVGASGAIFGVIGIMLAAAVRGAVTGGIRRKMYGTAATFVAYQFLAEFQGFAKGGSGIDQIAHGSGLLIGFLICLSSVALVAGGQLQVSIKRVASVAAGFLLVVFVGGASFIPSKAWEPQSCLDEAVEDLSDSPRESVTTCLGDFIFILTLDKRNHLSMQQTSENDQPYYYP